MKKRRKVLTRNKEIYEKFNMLNFSSEIILKNATKSQVDKLLSNINRDGVILESEILGSYILIKRIGDFNFDVYYM